MYNLSGGANIYVCIVLILVLVRPSCRNTVNATVRTHNEHYECKF